MTPAPVGRRGLLSAGWASLGLSVLGACAPGEAPTVSRAPTASGTPTAPGTPTAQPSAPATPVTRAAPVAVEAPRLAVRLDRYLDGRGGTLGLEIVDLRRGEVFAYRSQPSECFSTIKVLVVMTLLRQAQEAGVVLTAREQRLAHLMVTRSDNPATEAVPAQVGRDEVRRVAGLAGMTRTEITDAGWWGHWLTVPEDLNLMVGAVLSGDTVLEGAHRATARFLAGVVAEQRWGVFAAEGSGAYVAAKNGWGPMADGYRLNSTGWVTDGGRDYQLSILSNSPAGFSYGRRTVSRVAGICHEALERRLA